MKKKTAKKKKKFVISFKVSNKNMLIRFRKEQEKDPSFTLTKLAEQFGILNLKGVPDRSLVCRWISLNTKNNRLPTKTRLCPGCRKSVYQYVEEWINDGSIN